MSVDHIDDNVEFAVVEQIALSQAAAGDDIGQP